MKLLSLTILFAACAMAQIVEGTVFDAATGAGVAGVKVELLKGGTAFYETASDGRGGFRFDEIREGDYAVRYRHSDYWLTAGSSDYKLFHVAAGSPVRLEGRLNPWSKISGRVVDGRRNGVPDAQLQLTVSGMLINGRTYVRTSWGGGGGGQLSAFPPGMTFTGKTDANGKFEVQVMPGSYGISVVPPPDLKPPDREEDGSVLLWQRTWYPGVTVAEAASKIVVSPGGEVSGVELKLRAVPAHAVRGLVLNPDGSPASKVSITLGTEFRHASAESKPDGTFEFPAVPEGEWRFSAESQSGSVRLRAIEWVEVKGHDLENVKLRLTPPLTLLGKITIQPSKDEPAPPRLGPFVLSRLGGHTRGDDDPVPGGIALIEPGLNGDLRVLDVYPGVYRLGTMLQPPPPPYYLDSIQVGGADLARQDVEITSDTALMMTYKTDGGSVRGKAENCNAGGVVLVPADPTLRRPGFSKSGPCDSTDRYEVLALRPGEYFALAFAGNGPVVTVDESLLNQAVRVTVRTGEASSVDLKTVTKPVFEN
jgi:Carboxypeptidase regulatory-like domain